MKQVILMVTFCLALGTSFFAGTLLGRAKAVEGSNFANEVGAEQQLALLLEALNELENGETSKVRWMLQSSTAGQLETIIDNADFENKSLEKFRCALLNRYKKYYGENKLFSTQAWASLMQVEGIREAREKREEFLEIRLPKICLDSK